MNRIRHFPSLESTNTYAMDLISSEAPPEGTAIVADYQKGGRGQRGSKWVSNPGENLLCSFILYPEINVNQQFILSQVISLSVAHLLRKINLPAMIKWPNDILVNNHKISGILIENSVKGTLVSSSVTGAGINVNQQNFPNDINATSVKTLTGNPMHIKSFTHQFIDSFDYFYFTLFKNTNYKAIVDDYHSHLYLYNQPARFRDENGIFEGIIKYVTQEGKLAVAARGTTKFYSNKEIEFLSI